MFFTRCDSEVGDSHCKILRSIFIDGNWSKGDEVFAQKPGVNYGDPVLIENDNVLIFTSNDPTGIGAHDLYYSLRNEDGSWTDPDLMPPYLNTIGEERFPRWDNGVLYYSSDFLPGLGGLDIFKTSLNEDNSWTQPENVLAPINSSEDDYCYVPVPNEFLTSDIKKRIYFTSTRGVFGNDDLYSLTEYKSKDEIEKVDTLETAVPIEVVEDPKLLFLQIRIQEKIYAVPSNPNSYIVGLKNVSQASIRFTSPNREDIFLSKEDGTILLPIDTGSVYKILVGKSGYLNNGLEYQITEDYKNLTDGQVLELNIEIEKIFEGVEIVMDNIYYDYNQSVIRDDAKPALDYLVKILRDNPAVKIQLSSHTDCRGEEDYNQTLSQARATSAVEYIVQSGGISMAKLNAVGYGESSPEIICSDCNSCSEDEHQINRRTTFKVIE
jgi:peptidoglycan-associated lipoprotein